MASVQAKTVNGRKYWQIVQSRRINGKPRPVVIEHLGTADSLLKKLRKPSQPLTVKSYSHGLLIALLKKAEECDLISNINKYVLSQRKYFADKPIRNNLTVGATLLFAAIGRVCLPTSKRGWFTWAKGTSLSYLLHMNFSKINSQHFWDMMDSLPAEAIEKIELELLQNIRSKHDIRMDSLFYDTTNFYTYIATTNQRCAIAQRGKNKQKRTDLRQVGLAMVVSKNDFIPLFHESYRGNMNDAPVFKKVIVKIKARMIALGLDIKKHTIVFDRGCNSKKNLKLISELKMFYLGALTPAHHEKLIKDAEGNYCELKVDGETLHVFRDKREIWSEDRTVLVFVSEKLKEGQIRGIYSELSKKSKALKELNQALKNTRAKKYTRKELLEKIGKILNNSGQVHGIITFELKKQRNGPYYIDYEVDKEALEELEDSMGFRIIMSNRHGWNSHDIIKGYYGQSFIENSFKNLKNPFHLAITPGFHWTDQKIKIHFFTCILGYTLTALVWKQVKELTDYSGNLDNLLDTLNGIRLATIIENTPKKGKPKIIYQLEQMDRYEEKIVSALGIRKMHENKIKIKGISVYK